MPDETLKSIAKVIQGIAPTIATIFAGPKAGEFTDIGLSTLAKWLGLQSDNPDPVAVLQAAQTAVTDPQTRLAIIQAENDFALKMKGLEIQAQGQQIGVLLAGLVDIQNARQAEVEKTKATGKRDINIYALAWLLVLGFLSLTVCLMFRALPPDSTGVIFMLFGAISSGFGAVIQYFFGSSIGSKEKDRLLLNSTPPGKG